MRTKDNFDPSKLTPAFLAQVFKAQQDLIAKHEQIRLTLYEMMASICYHAPVVRPCKLRFFALRGVVIEQPSHWLVFGNEDKHRVRAYAEDTLTEPSVPPRPLGFMIPTGKFHESRDGSLDAYYLCLRGKEYLGVDRTARGVYAITSYER